MRECRYAIPAAVCLRIDKPRCPVMISCAKYHVSRVQLPDREKERKESQAHTEAVGSIDSSPVLEVLDMEDTEEVEKGVDGRLLLPEIFRKVGCMTS